LSRCHPASETVTVAHGSRVETTPHWFCEAAWAGRYESGAFDHTDIVAGTGGRLRDGAVVFVSSGSTVDRLNSVVHAGAAWVSNSLPCLLAATGIDLDITFPRYFRQIRTVVRGIRDYARFLPTTAEPVQFTYFDNLVWDGRTLFQQPKPGLGRDFSSFGSFRAFLAASMQQMADNMADRLRRRPFTMLSTASSGYDSSTAAVLAREAGCRRVMCVDHGPGLDDSGEPLAGVVGLSVVKIPRQAWREHAAAEVPFVAADSHGGDVFFKGAEAALDGAVLMTGFHGDKIWDKHPKDLSDRIVRGDQSGLSLTEYRLMAGFLHCPVPFWGVRQIRDVNAISRSRELESWDVPGDYSRPICRRIVEEAGVPREMFGTRKKATWIQFLGSADFLTPPSLASYLDWLGEHRSAWFRHGRVPPLRSVSLDRFERACRDRCQMPPQHGHVSLATRVRAAIAERPTWLRRHVFPWAVERVKARYPSPF
jgi:hypothetical protein